MQDQVLANSITPFESSFQDALEPTDTHTHRQTGWLLSG